MGGLGDWRPGTKVDFVKVEEKIELGHYRVVLRVGAQERHTEVSVASGDLNRRHLARYLGLVDADASFEPSPLDKLVAARVADRIWESLDG